VTLVAFFLLASSWPPISLAEAGFKDANFVSFHRVGQDLLVVGPADNLVALFDADGKLVARLTKASFGALSSPLPLGVTKEHILLVSNGTQVQGFDHRLRPVPHPYKNLPLVMIGSSYIGHGFFLANTYGCGPHAVTILSFDGSWSVIQQLIPLQYNESKTDVPATPTSWVTVHGKLGFQWVPMEIGAEQYQAQIYDLAEGAKKPRLVLSHAVGAPEPSGVYWPYLTEAFQKGDHFLVCLVLANAQTGKVMARYLDSFTPEGKFLKRRNMPLSRELRQVYGDQTILCLDNESMKLKSLSPN